MLRFAFSVAAILLVRPVYACAAPLLTQHHPSGLLELRLNRPAKLNALDGSLVHALQEGVTRARKDGSVTSVLLTAEGDRAFCAGGDIKAAAALPLAEAKQFLEDEYKLMLELHALNQLKPVVALADGFVIGAGAGLFMSAGTRIASRASSFSMPECVLGITPDVGATDFLFGSMPGQCLGRWAGLTGARLDIDLMVATGLATHEIAAEGTRGDAGGVADDALDERVAQVRERLIAAGGSLESMEAALATEASAASASAAAHRARVERLEDAAARAFDAVGAASGSSTPPSRTEHAVRVFDRIYERLGAEEAAAAADGDEDLVRWARDARLKVSRGCPAALLVAFECSQAALPDDPYMRRAQALGIELVANQALAARPGFQEGVACAVGSKRGEAPSWEHASVQESAADPEVQAILERVRQAPALSRLYAHKRP